MELREGRGGAEERKGCSGGKEGVELREGRGGAEGRKGWS